MSQKSTGDILSSLNELKKENERLTTKINWLFTEKTESAKQLNQLQLELEEKLNKEKDYIEKEKQFKFIEENKAKKKENELILKNKKTGNNKNEIYIGDPNKFNIEMNNELVQTRSLIKKYSHFYHQEKLVSHNLKERVKELEDNIKKLNNGILLKKQETNINLIDCLFSDDDDDYYLDDDDYDNKKDDDDIQFPDKFNNLVKTSENITKVPKLDLSQVLSKYKKLENVKVVENKNKISHRSGDGEIIEKLNAQIRIFKQTIQRYKDSIKNLREQLSILRNRNKILESTLKNNYQNKFNNNNINNDISMNVNVSQIGDNFNFQNDINNIESETKLDNIEINDEKKEN